MLQRDWGRLPVKGEIFKIQITHICQFSNTVWNGTRNGIVIKVQICETGERAYLCRYRSVNTGRQKFYSDQRSVKAN